MNILDAMKDDKVFGKHFTGDTWDTWRVFLCALFALPMLPEQVATYARHTGRSTPPTQPLQEAWLCCGRRSGKSFILACVAIFLAAFRDWRPFLGPGEVGTVMIIAADRRQARVIMRYCLGLLRAVPMLRQLIEGHTQEAIQLRNRIAIEIHTASFRSTRGYTVVAALLDEIAYWPTDEASRAPDVEIINAIRPGLSTVHGSMLLAASSPHARRGALWDAFRRHHGRDGDPVLVWTAATREMNTSVPQTIIDAALEDDPARASAEWLAMFRSDVEAFISREAVEACVGAYYEIPPATTTTYCAFTDPSTGASDSFTLAIAHRDGERAIIDCIRETRPPFSPESTIAEYSALLKRYRITKIVGDRVGGEFSREQFRKRNILYELSKKSKSDIYLNFISMLNSGTVVLPRHDKLVNQLCSLERTVSRGTGHETIDHPRDMHDDVANSAAGAAILAAAKVSFLERWGPALDDRASAGPDLRVHIFNCTGHWP